MFYMKFRNTNEAPIFIQVDPWAGLYKLWKGDEVTIAVKCNTDCSSFDYEEYKDTRIIVIPNAEEYFVEKDGKLVHWTEYSSNILD